MSTRALALPFFFVIFAYMMNNENRKRKPSDWIIAMRPWAFSASAMPILVMWGMLFYGQAHGQLTVDWPCALLCLPLLVLVHAGGNMVSDYFDHTRGVDQPEGPNGVTWIFNGLFKPKEILCYGLALIAVGTCIGIVLLLRSGWEGLWIGLAGLVLALGYFWMKGHWLGDVNIICSFSLLPAVGTMFVATGDYHWESMLYLLPLGLLIVSILHANNTRDIHNDHRAGLETLSIRLGGKAAKYVYLAETLTPYVLTVAFCLWCGQPRPLLLVLFTLPLAMENNRAMMGADNMMEGQIPTLDKSTSQLQLMFGILYTAGYFIGAWT